MDSPDRESERRIWACSEFGKEDNLFHMSHRWQSTTFINYIPNYLTFTRYGQEEAEDLKKVDRGKRKGRWRERGSGQKA